MAYMILKGTVITFNDNIDILNGININMLPNIGELFTSGIFNDEYFGQIVERNGNELRYVQYQYYPDSDSWDIKDNGRITVYSSEIGWNEAYKTITFIEDCILSQEYGEWIEKNATIQLPKPVEPEADEYGSISGKGDSASRINEITADDVAVYRNFCVGYKAAIDGVGGVCYEPNHDFDCILQEDEESLTVKAGTTIHFNDTPDLINIPFNTGYYYRINFKANNKEYNGIRITKSDYVFYGYYILEYFYYQGIMPISEEAYKIEYVLGGVVISRTWNEGMQDITITEDKIFDDSGIKQWFLENTDLELYHAPYIHLTDGMAFAYGYFGYCAAMDIDILPPAVEQYHIIYLELNKSVIPNTCEVKVRNNQSSPRILNNAFRQDQLSTIKTGVFQMPLWIIKITNKGIVYAKDLRNIKKGIENVVDTVNSSNVVDGGVLGLLYSAGLLGNVRAETQPQGTRNKTVATTAFVQNAIQTEINK